MNEEQKRKVIENMTENLSVLRKKLNFSQEDLAQMIGVSRSTIANIESGRNKMTWSTFLALLLIFTKHKETDKLLNILEIYTDELNGYIKHNNSVF